jgi:plasmid stabilization system protein ParE
LKIKLAKLALQDLQSTKNYISQDKPDAALAVVQRVIEAIENIALFPSIGRSGRVPHTRNVHEITSATSIPSCHHLGPIGSSQKLDRQQVHLLFQSSDRAKLITIWALVAEVISCTFLKNWSLAEHLLSKYRRIMEIIYYDKSNYDR